MHHRPKVGPPLLRPSCLLLLLMTTEIFAHPAIPQSYLQQGNYLDKTQFQPAAQLQETIDEVQKILQRDPTLPRLTR